MTFGIQTFNDAAAELTISDAGTTYSYLGKAPNVSLTQASSSTTGGITGRSTYSFSWAGDIIIALPIKEAAPTTLFDITQSGSTWTITILCSNGSRDSNGFDIQATCDVYVFGAPVSVSGYGMALYRDDGSVCADLSKKPMVFRYRISLTSDPSNSIPIPTLSIPLYIGNAAGSQQASNKQGATSYQNLTYTSAYSLNVGQFAIDKIQTRWTQDDTAGPISNTIRYSNALILDGADFT